MSSGTTTGWSGLGPTLGSWALACYQALALPFLMTDTLRANARFSSCCSLYITTMYTIQYWNERDAEWRGTGSGSISDYDCARQRMRALSEQCNYCCTFRIDPQPPRGCVVTVSDIR